jgi:large repetitive protein
MWTPRLLAPCLIAAVAAACSSGETTRAAAGGEGPDAGTSSSSGGGGDAGPAAEPCPPPIDWAKVDGATQLGDLLASPTALFVHQCIALVEARPDAGYSELWRTNGFESGTFQLGTSLPSLELSYPYSLKDAVIFQSEQGIWRTDGSQAGTTKLLDGVWTYSYHAGGAVLGDALVFTARDSLGDSMPVMSAYGHEPWITDGTASGTNLLVDLVPSDTDAYPGPADYTVAGGALYFWNEQPGTGFLAQRRHVLYRSDGTAAGTQEVIEVDRAHQLIGPGAVTVLGADLVFVGSTPSVLGLYRSDGTAAGTTLLAPLSTPPTGGTSTYGFEDYFYLAVVGKQVYLLASSHAYTFEGNTAYSGPPVDALWVTDGTVKGTRLVTELPHVEYSEQYGLPSPLTVLGDAVYFWTLDESGMPRAALYRSQGSAASTLSITLSEGFGAMAPMGNALYFWAGKPESGAELWRTQGTVETTQMVRDIQPGKGSSAGGQIFVLDGHLVFSADDGVHGFEPWISDGTEAGTRLAADIVPGAGGSKPERFERLGGTVIFMAGDHLFRL